MQAWPGAGDDFEALNSKPGDLPTGVLVGTVAIVDCQGKPGITNGTWPDRNASRSS